MKVLTLWQPWASLIACGLKVHETRSWSTDYRGGLAIHAAKRPVDSSGKHLLHLLRVMGYQAPEPPFPLGTIVAFGELVSVEPAGPLSQLDIAFEADDMCGDFSAGRWAWRIAGARPVSAPVPWRGRQGLRNLPSDVAEEVWRRSRQEERKAAFFNPDLGETWDDEEQEERT